MSQTKNVALLEKFCISPPLLNSSNPWANDASDLLTLYASPHTGAVTIRTSLVSGFKQNRHHHQYTFFSSSIGHGTAEINLSSQGGQSTVKDGETSSLNTYGYSPTPFEDYLVLLKQIRDSGFLSGSCPFPGKIPRAKPFIISVTGNPEEITQCYFQLLCVHNELKSVKSRESGGGLSVMTEINLSCPNIPGKPPAAYDADSLYEYLYRIAPATTMFNEKFEKFTRKVYPVHVGIKTPPYTHTAQFEGLLKALERLAEDGGPYPLSFITATNTLGSCLVLDADNHSSLGSANGMGIGGMAGDALHPISLGNVKTIRTMLDASKHEVVRNIRIIGVGGVKNKAGFERMRAVGAAAVGVGTAFGRDGMSSFCKISEEKCDGIKQFKGRVEDSKLVIEEVKE
jgi:dihydroorotate dehydrogenase (fumarate)